MSLFDDSDGSSASGEEEDVILLPPLVSDGGSTGVQQSGGRAIADASVFEESMREAQRLRKRDRDNHAASRVQRQREEEKKDASCVSRDKDVGVFVTQAYRDALRCSKEAIAEESEEDGPLNQLIRRLEKTSNITEKDKNEVNAVDSIGDTGAGSVAATEEVDDSVKHATDADSRQSWEGDRVTGASGRDTCVRRHRLLSLSEVLQLAQEADRRIGASLNCACGM